MPDWPTPWPTPSPPEFWRPTTTPTRILLFLANIQHSTEVFDEREFDRWIWIAHIIVLDERARATPVLQRWAYGASVSRRIFAIATAASHPSWALYLDLVVSREGVGVLSHYHIYPYTTHTQDPITRPRRARAQPTGPERRIILKSTTKRRTR